MNWPDAQKYLLAKAQEVLPLLWGPTALATYPLWEDRLLEALQKNISPHWQLRLLVLLLAICLFLGTWLFVKRTQFIEHRGAFFKRKDRHGFHEAVYCGICKSPAFIKNKVHFTDEHYFCKCGWQSSFQYGDFINFFPTLKP